MRSQEGSDSKDEDALALFAKLLSDTDEAVPESEDNALLGLASAFSDADEDEADASALRENAITGDGRTVRQCKQDRQDNCLTEPCTGIRYREPKLGSIALAELLEAKGTTLKLEQAEKQLSVAFTASQGFNVIAIIGRRDAKDTKTGQLFLRWLLTDLKSSTVRCFVFGDAAHSLSQLRAGSVVAIFRCRFGDSESHGNSLKVLDADQVQLIGTSADMSYCAGTTKAGIRCGAVVNKALRQQYCDLHLSQAKQAIAMRARPECKGTLLVTALDPPTQRRGGGGNGSMGRWASWQKKLAAGGIPGTQRCSTQSLKQQAEQYLAHNAASAGARALTSFCDQEHHRTIRQQLKRREAALYHKPSAAPAEETEPSQNHVQGEPKASGARGTFQQRLLGRLQSEALHRSGKTKVGSAGAASFADSSLRDGDFGVRRAAALAAGAVGGGSEEGKEVGKQSTGFDGQRRSRGRQQQQRGEVPVAAQRSADCSKSKAQGQGGQSEPPVCGKNKPECRSPDRLCTHSLASELQPAWCKPAEPCTEGPVQAASAAHADVSHQEPPPEGQLPRAVAEVQPLQRRRPADQTEAARRQGNDPAEAAQRRSTPAPAEAAQRRPSGVTEAVRQQHTDPADEGRRRPADPAEAARQNAEARMRPCNHADKVPTGRPVSRPSMPSRPGASLDMSTARRVHRLVHSIHQGAVGVVAGQRRQGREGQSRDKRERPSAAGGGERGQQKKGREGGTEGLRIVRAASAPGPSACAATEVQKSSDLQEGWASERTPASVSTAADGGPSACPELRCSDDPGVNTEKEGAGCVLQCTANVTSPRASNKTTLAEGISLKRCRAGSDPGTGNGVNANAVPSTARERAKAAMEAAKKLKCAPAPAPPGPLSQPSGAEVLRTRHMVNPLRPSLQTFPNVPEAGTQPGKLRSAPMRQRPTSQRPTSLGAYAYEDSEWGVRDDGRSFVEARKVLRPEDSTKKASAAKEEEAGSGGEPTTEFERAFGRQEDADGDENNDRLRKLAEDAEWGTFREKVEHLGDLERIEERMEACMSLQVSALQCETCGALSERPQARCTGHSVKVVTVTKRFFRCTGCGRRTSALSRRMPAWGCDSCKANHWEACSMYGKRKDMADEMEQEMFGYADKSRLKVRGEEQKWVLA